MRIQIASDLNHELSTGASPWRLPLSKAKAADLLVLAGNIHTGTQGIDLYRSIEIPVVYVSGTHELFGADLREAHEAMRRVAVGTSVSYLEREELRFSDVRVLGCCLWTDFLLGPCTQQHAMYEAGRFLNEYRLIGYHGEPFSPHHALAEHIDSRQWLEQRLNSPFAGRTIVVTHFAPLPESLPSRFDNNPLNPSDASDLRALVEKADLWVHGRIQSGCRYVVGKSLIACNPRGLPKVSKRDSPTDSMNPHFNGALVLNL
jgi:hypothetical protein